MARVVHWPWGRIFFGALLVAFVLNVLLMAPLRSAAQYSMNDHAVAFFLVGVVIDAPAGITLLAWLAALVARIWVKKIPQES